MTWNIHFTDREGSDRGHVSVDAGTKAAAEDLARQGIKSLKVARVEPAAPLSASSVDADFEAWLDAIEPTGEPEPTKAEIEEEAAWLAATLERIQAQAEAARRVNPARQRVARVLHLENRPPAA
ncbi:MAG: hypothetical protein HY291_02165 [Planctomycetes bacterium]|nr:hypothetical protein [Planctomycetota bacterium]